MTMLLQFAILSIVLIHFAWIVCISAGGVLALSGALTKSPKLEAGYLVVVSLTVLNRLLDKDCWLTKAELLLRDKLTGQALHYGYIEHYLSIVNIHLKDGFLFFVGAVWISIGLCAVAYYEFVGHKRKSYAVHVSEV